MKKYINLKKKKKRGKKNLSYGDKVSFYPNLFTTDFCDAQKYFLSQTR